MILPISILFPIPPSKQSISWSHLPIFILPLIFLYPTSCIPPNLCWTPLCWSVFCFKEKLFFGQSWEYIGRSIGYNSQSTSEKHLWTWRFEFIFLETTPNPLETCAVFVVLVPPSHSGISPGLWQWYHCLGTYLVYVGNLGLLLYVLSARYGKICVQ